MIAIKDFEMPKCCDDCWALDDNGDYPFCLIIQETRGYNFQTGEKRMDKCPLIEVNMGEIFDMYDPVKEY